MKRSNIVLGLLFTALLGCNSGTNNTNDKFAVDVSIEDSVAATESDEVFIFYNFFSPVDLKQIIDETNGYYNATLVNSLNNIPKYNVTHKIALNIGVYGADLSYLWIFEQNQQALAYLAAIQHLTTKLGIPEGFVALTVDAAEKNKQSIDTLLSIARDAYYVTNKYLNGSDRENAAALILIGGWVESLHISLEMYNQPNAKLASKIISQKYALNSLITLIQSHQEDLVMTEYLLLLRRLNDSFRVFESTLKPEDINIDTLNKKITINESSALALEPKQFDDLRKKTANIRQHIID